MAKEEFWNEQENAKNISRKLASLEDEFLKWDNFKKEADDLLELGELMEGDDKAEKEIEDRIEKLQREFNKLEFLILFSGKYDENNVILSIHAGTGGVDAQDWAQMLLRMVLRFCERHDFRAIVVDETRGSEAGIKSATLEIFGRYAYGWLKSEAGVHRLVRISPFDAEKMRHTSFSLVEVIPEIPEAEEAELKPEEIRIDTFMSGGHGGQSVNTTYSAVRVVHLPTGITVSCQNERSQLQNKQTALKILKSKLFQLKAEEHNKALREVKGEYLKAQWGNQIRSYILQPYKLVKDHRTKFESKDPDKVLDGEIEGFAEEYLKSIKESGS